MQYLVDEGFVPRPSIGLTQNALPIVEWRMGVRLRSQTPTAGSAWGNRAMLRILSGGVILCLLEVLLLIRLSSRG